MWYLEGHEEKKYNVRRGRGCYTLAKAPERSSASLDLRKINNVVTDFLNIMKEGGDIRTATKTAAFPANTAV